ncbi:EEF1A lysine methyltransferase 4 [Brachionichthys hirsutus]|uniref:EEF1A lysine methyltransferase 4 n=1 Tax=Brachionichthys hirsutus TaxID=412623 RepID=UPI0036046839
MDYLPEDNSRYKQVDYWDDRYRTEETYDWLGSFCKFQHLLENHVNKEDCILVLGCGNSSMSGDMYGAGYQSITNVDYSSVCVRALRARHRECPGMTWHEMDLQQLLFPDASFDVILEKATLDAIMVEEKSPWNLSTRTAATVHQALTEVSRCLKPGGRFVSITFASPILRKRLYAHAEYSWSVKTYSYDGGFEYYVYVMTKGEALSSEDAALEKRQTEGAESTPDTVTLPEEKTADDFLSKIDL